MDSTKDKADQDPLDQMADTGNMDNHKFEDKEEEHQQVGGDPETGIPIEQELLKEAAPPTIKEEAPKEKANVQTEDEETPLKRKRLLMALGGLIRVFIIAITLGKTLGDKEKESSKNPSQE
jgi:hypothetical protein